MESTNTELIGVSNGRHTSGEKSKNNNNNKWGNCKREMKDNGRRVSNRRQAGRLSRSRDLEEEHGD